MSSFFSFSPKVEELGSYYLVTGININSLEYDLRTNFGTTVIFNRLIAKVSSRSFKIHKFWMVELSWLLDHLTNQTNPRVIKRYEVGMYKYKQLFEEIKEKTWIQTTFQTHQPYDVDKAVRHFTKTPFPTQREFLLDYSRIKYGYQLKGCLLDAAVGSGKSLTALMWSKMISDGKLFLLVPRTLITSPWLNEIKESYKKPPKVWTSIDGTDIFDHLDAEIFIIHKEQLRTGAWDKAIRAITKNGKEPAKAVVDESHNFNEHTSQQTKGLIEFCTHPFISETLEMSGTPIKAQGRETYALFAIIDKYFDAKVRDNFLKMYGRDNTYLNEMLAHRLGRIKFTIPSVMGMNNPPEPQVINISFPGAEKFTLDSIRDRMMVYITQRVAFYRKHLPEYQADWKQFLDNYRHQIANDAGDVKDLEKYVEIVRHFQVHGYNNFTDAPLSKFASKVEKRIEEGLKGEELKYFRHIKSAVKYVGLKIRGEALGNVLGKARMEAVRAVIEHAELPKLINSAKKKTLIYTSYIDVIDELKVYLDKEGFNVSHVHGDNSTEIDQIVSEFRDNQDVNPLCTTFSTLREGKPMLMANQIILMNSPFRSYELTQTIARIYRYGQTEECFVWLISLDTQGKENITSRSIDIMEWSKAAVEQLLGGGKIPGSDELGSNLLAIGGMERYASEEDIRNYDEYYEGIYDEISVPVEEDVARVVPPAIPKLSLLSIF